MSDAVEAIGAISGEDKPGARMALEQITNRTQSEVVQGANFSRIAEKAIGSAVQRPHVEENRDAARRALVDPTKGVVGEARSEVVSTVERPGAPKKEVINDSASLQDQQQERIRALYLDLTNYQIAWKIAQRMQQDITQLMRGS